MEENIDDIQYDHENVALFCGPNYSTPLFFSLLKKDHILQEEDVYMEKMYSNMFLNIQQNF